METGEQMALVEHLQNQAREYSGGITMADTGANTPSAFVIGSPIRPLLKIHNDGTVEADIADMPEAAKVLAEHVQMHMQQWAEAHRAAERATLQATVERQAAEIARLRGVLEAIEAGTIPRPVETPWFPDGRPSKHDRCKHDAWMYQACEGCTDAFIRQALGDHNG